MNVKQILADQGFRFKKQFGQNFITDTNLLQAMVQDAGVTESDTVLEIGAGAGTLTRALAQTARRVVAFEIDRNLMPVLDRTLQGLDGKVEVVLRDIMQVGDTELDAILDGSYKVVANLPYYITTPILMRFLERRNKPLSATVMIQKEVAQRLVAPPACADYGVITLAIALEGDARVMRQVPRQMFCPQPNVDSAIVRIDLHDRYADADKAAVKRAVTAGFAMRRKTLANNLIHAYRLPRERIERILQDLGLSATVRGETLDLQTYLALSARLAQAQSE